MRQRFLRGAIAAAMLSVSAGAAFAQAASAPSTATAPATPGTPGTPAAMAAESGKVAWYGNKFAGRKTASGERFNPEAMTMAHKTLPFGTRVEVTNPKNGKSVTLRVNDRGPTQADRVGDVSLAAARKLGMVKAGAIDAELTVVGNAPAN